MVRRSGQYLHFAFAAHALLTRRPCLKAVRFERFKDSLTGENRQHATRSCEHHRVPAFGGWSFGGSKAFCMNTLRRHAVARLVERVDHGVRAAAVEMCPWRRCIHNRREVRPQGIRIVGEAQMHVLAKAWLREFVEQRRRGTAPRSIVQLPGTPLGSESLRHTPQRRDADSAGDQNAMGRFVCQHKIVLWTGNRYRAADTRLLMHPDGSAATGRLPLDSEHVSSVLR